MVGRFQGIVAGMVVALVLANQIVRIVSLDHILYCHWLMRPTLVQSIHHMDSVHCDHYTMIDSLDLYGPMHKMR